MRNMWNILEGIDELRNKLLGVAAMHYIVAESTEFDKGYCAPAISLLGDTIYEIETQMEALIKEAHEINRSSKIEKVK